MPINPLDGFPTAGVAGQYSETITPALESILAGDAPLVFATVETVATTQDLAALTVVGFNGSGEIIPAVLGTTEAVGVLVYPQDTSGGAHTAQVYRGGNFNPDRLVWDATYDTDAKKAKAFEGAPSPTQIVITKTETFTAPA